MTNENEIFEARYLRSKALGFGTLMLMIGCAIAWVAWDALDQTWQVAGEDGAVLQALPVWIRVPAIISVGIVVFIPGATMIRAGLMNSVIVRANHHGISSKTIFGRRRALSWSAIKSAHRSDKNNQIVLSPWEKISLAHEIWDGQSVLLDVGMLDRPVSDTESMIKHFRPQLEIIQGESR